MSPELRMTRARTKLLLDHPWFGTLAMRLAIKSDATINPPTMCVDGVTLSYHPVFLNSLSDDELIGVLAHEVMHCALLHMFRRGSRDHVQWNVAADYAINQVIIDSGLILPQGALLNAKYKGMSADQIYSKLSALQQPQSKNGQGNPSPTGQFTDAPSSSGKGQSKPNPNGPIAPGMPDPSDMTEKDWQIAAEQATMAARKAGKMPGEVDRAVKETRESSADWRQILREFVAATVPSDYSWSHPNRRHIANGLYLPGTIKENIGELVIAVDTSGSIDAKMLSAFAGELTAILTDARPDKLHVVYCDAQVQSNEEFIPGDEVVLHAKGGGGTLFTPIFDWVASRQDTGDLSDIKALIYLTDLECYDKPVAPSYPVLWCAPLWATHPAPDFGELVKVDIEQ